MFLQSLVRIGLVVLAFNAMAVEGLPDFEADRAATLEDALHGGHLYPRFGGSGYEFPTATMADWNADGLIDLIVGYNMRDPDLIRMVVYLNIGQGGAPAFTGDPSHAFFVAARRHGQSETRIFEDLGFHEPAREHKFMTFVPTVVDVNGDGLFDILAYEGVRDVDQQRGQWLLLNRGEIGAPKFTAFYLHSREHLDKLPPGAYIELLRLYLGTPKGERSSFAALSVTDWNSDGALDLVYSGTQTAVAFGRTTASGGWGAQSDHWEIQMPTGSDGFGREPHLVAADFDGDGINELVSASTRSSALYRGGGHFSLFVRDAESQRFVLKQANLFTLNSKKNPWVFPDWQYPWYMARNGWWHPRIAALDVNDDGKIDIVAGWGGGNDQKQYGDRIYTYLGR
ncbi:MAG: VCBS repeat-containing protein [Pseudomonadota bacterium]